jgi:hypothetical protein
MLRPHWYGCSHGNGMQRIDKIRHSIEAMVHVQLERPEHEASRPCCTSQYWHGVTVFLLEV